MEKRKKIRVGALLLAMGLLITLQSCTPHYCAGVQGTGNYACYHHRR